MAHFEAVTPDAVEFTGERFTPEAGNASDQRSGLRGKPRRTWPQRFLMLAGLLVSVVCFGAAFVFWQANIVLNDIPRISVGPDVLAQGGGPGEPVNILLLGVDSSEGLDEDDPVRSGRETEDEARGIVRPDTILIARLDPATGTGSVLSLPRDLIVNVEGGTSTRLNATQVIGGIGGLITAIDETLSIPVNHFVQVDFAGFSDIVDIVGGVPVHFPFPTRDLGSGLSIPQSGCINLNGSQALSYVRARSIEELIDDEWQDLPAPVPDLARIARQQEFLVLTTEEILDVGRADVSRITSFIDAGTQAVQLDAELTPGEIADLASAFSDFDTDALDISTLPVGAAFSETGAYIGEELRAEQSRDLLARFQGLDDGVRPSDVAIAVSSSEDRHVEELGERGFVASSVGEQDATTSTVYFDPADRDQALLVARYLETLPRLVAETGATLRLEVGPDFSGVRVFPRPVADVSGAVAQAVTAAVSATTTTVAPPTAPPATAATPSPDDTSAAETSVPAFASEDEVDVLSSPEAEEAINPAVEEAPSPLSTAVRGRPPEGIGCTTIGG